MPSLPQRPPAAAAAGEDSDEELDEGEDVEYMLGFVEPPERPTDLLRHRFPSKVGGPPAWLDPLNLPTPGQLTCGSTGQLLRFLLQVYCPLEANPEAAFHRSVFLFVSPKGADLSQPGAVRALRCQLPRANAFYADTPAPPGQLTPPPLPAGQAALALARDPWRVLEREAAAAAGAAGDGGGDAAAAAGPPCFHEQELLVEAEPLEDEPEDGEGAAAGGHAAAAAAEAGGADVQRLLAAYQARVASEGEYDEAELPADLMDELEGAAGPERATFAAFQARCCRAPEQVLRYSFQAGAAPLWPSAKHRPGPADVPPCPHCGCDRRFEFQVMPQLLSFMGLDVEDPQAPDWGTIAVYSCPRSCSAPPVQGPEGHSSYSEEFVWVQPS